ncbi:MAG: methyltransferase domain-containing protein [Oscillospiraceae bacterium]|jgi:tellurite methyltransferase|nr:methyltransferase domain-containing protein [Oscillospiraceae bacterium]
MQVQPFWEQAYQDPNAVAFSKEPTVDLAEFHHLIVPGSTVLDVGCGEGRNAIFLAGLGNHAEGFDLSEAGIAKAQAIAAAQNLDVRFCTQDLAEFAFARDYDVILSHGVLHLPEKSLRNAFIKLAQTHTMPGGLHFIGVFTNRLPAAPDMVDVTKSLFDVGELPTMYDGWEILHHWEGTFRDEHPGGVRHHHAYEKIIARKTT